MFEIQGREGSAAAMAVTAAQTRKGPGRVDTKQEILQAVGRSKNCSNRVSRRYSIGTTISLCRTIFKRLRAAASMARGSLSSWFTSLRNAWLLLLKVSTSVRIRVYCCDARFIRSCVRIVTVTHTAKVARMIMPKITQAGIIPPRRRTSVRVPIMSSDTARACDNAVV
jgi:hypothetical protein